MDEPLTMRMDLSILIVVPTYNEADNLSDLVSGIERVRVSHPVEVLIVDDGSPDGTGRLVEALGATRAWLHLLERERPLGLGSAYRAGFRWALERGYDLIGEMDADLSHDPAHLPELIRAARDGACLALGSRYVPGGRTEGWPLRRRALSRTANVLAATSLGLPVRDATGGFRVYGAEAVEAVLAAGTRCDGYGFQVEAVSILARGMHPICEVPIVFRDRTRGASKLSSRVAVEAARRLVTLWIEGRSGDPVPSCRAAEPSAVPPEI